MLDGLAVYERRHGWKGHLENVLTENAALAGYQHPDWEDEPETGRDVHALVTDVAAGSATLKLGRFSSVLIQADAAWTQQKLQEILKPGDLVYVKIVALGPDGKAKVSLEQDSGCKVRSSPSTMPR